MNASRADQYPGVLGPIGNGDRVDRRVVPNGRNDGTDVPGTLLCVSCPDPKTFRAWLLARGNSTRTAENYAGIMRRAQSAVGDLRHATMADLAAYLSGWKPWTRNTYMSALIATYDWLELSGQIEQHPFRSLDRRERLRRDPMPEPDPDPLTEAEQARLIAAARVAGGDLYAWVLLGLRQGMRAFEIAKIRGEHLHRGELEIVGKGRRTRRVPIHDDIRELADFYPSRGFWFPSSRASTGHITERWIGGQVHMLFGTLGLHGSIHRCRHTFITTLVLAGYDLETVRQLSGHASLDMLTVYTRITSTRRREAIDSLGNAPAWKGHLSVVE